jgi:hypothetical protein
MVGGDPASVHSYNNNTGVWAFTTASGVPYSGKFVKGERPAVGANGQILPYENGTNYFQFLWFPVAAEPPHWGAFDPV